MEKQAYNFRTSRFQVAKGIGEDLSNESSAKYKVLRVGDRVSGYVKWFDHELGYGFIVLENDPTEKEHFVHHSYIKINGYRTLIAGQKVCFTEVLTNAGIQARDVVPEQKTDANSNSLHQLIGAVFMRCAKDKRYVRRYIQQ